MTVLLYGLGRSGLAAGRLLARQGHRPIWFDRRDDGPDVEAAIAAGWRRADDPRHTDADVCIAAPGVPIDHPDLVALRASGTETIGEVEWVFRTVDAPLIGVTGTAGKGTVTRWIESMLAADGRDAAAGGNLDPALAAVAEAGRWLVAEMSSFQLERCPTVEVRSAVLTRLGRDHLDRHGDVGRYHALKRRLVEATATNGLAVLNADDPVQRGWAEAGLPGRVAFYDATEDAPPARDARDVAGRIRDGRVVVFGDDLGSVDALVPRGTHQRANLLAAAVTAHDLGVPPATIAAVIPRLRTAPGRHETVAERCGVAFVDDSIATREMAVAAALEAASPPVAWIVGGRDKGADPEPLLPLVRERVLHVVGIGEAGPSFVDRFRSMAPGTVVDARDGSAAMRRAVRVAAEALPSGGGTVLLAPLAASFDQFRDYADRGAAFRSAVGALLQEEPWTGCS